MNTLHGLAVPCSFNSDKTGIVSKSFESYDSQPAYLTNQQQQQTKWYQPCDSSCCSRLFENLALHMLQALDLVILSNHGLNQVLLSLQAKPK